MEQASLQPKTGDMVINPLSKVISHPLLLPDILEVIFSYLNVKDKLSVARVCSTWRNVAYLPTQWRNVIAEVHEEKSSNPKLIATLATRGIQNIRLSQTNILTELVQGMPDLRSLYFSNYIYVTDDTLPNAFTQEMPNITKIDLSYCYTITDRSVKTITKYLVNLTHLDLSICNDITDAALKMIAGNLKKLTWLEVRSCDQLTDEGIDILAQGNLKLTYLGLKDCLFLTSMTLWALREGLICLEEINLSYVNEISDFGVEALEDFEHLVKLGLHSTQISDDSLSILVGGKSSSKLASLDLGDCYITDDGLHLLAKLTNLRHLDLSSCYLITDIGLTSICLGSTGVTLTSLKLDNGENITNETLKLLAKMTQLSDLGLSDCQKIDDEGLAYLAEQGSAITTLDLEGCTLVTDAALKSLATLFRLRVLTLSNCPNITDIGMTNLVEGNSRVAILALKKSSNVTDDGLKLLAKLVNLERILLNSVHRIADTGLFKLVETKDDFGIWLRTYIKVVD